MKFNTCSSKYVFENHLSYLGNFIRHDLKNKCFFHSEKPDSYSVYHQWINIYTVLGSNIDIGQKSTDYFWTMFYIYEPFCSHAATVEYFRSYVPCKQIKNFRCDQKFGSPDSGSQRLWRFNVSSRRHLAPWYFGLSKASSGDENLMALLDMQ